MLTLSNKKGVKRMSNFKSAFIIAFIVGFVFAILAIYGDMS